MNAPLPPPLPDRRRLISGLSGLAALAALPAAAAPKAAAAPVPPQVMSVGRGQSVKTLASACSHARDGMVIEVEAGDYVGDVAVWPQNNLVLRAVGGRVRMVANGQAAQGKAIFVTSGERISIEGFDFTGATVRDRNGAGIRLERGSLSLRDCSFIGNEFGLLTNNEPATRLEIDNCEFGAVRRGMGLSHNLYVGSIAYLRVTGSYFHHGHLGHLLKSRAAVNHIFYNRITDESGGMASYELEFPNGGVALVVGNLIEQSSTTENPHMVSFGAEGYTGPRHELHLIHNTLLDHRPDGGIYLRVSSGPAKVRVLNNVLAGNPHFATSGYWEQRGNFLVDFDAFVLATRDNYALPPDSPLRGKATDPGAFDGLALAPTRQYRHPRGTVALSGRAAHPGAIQQP